MTSTNTFAIARANLRYLRGVLPSYHDVLQRGTTQLLDMFYLAEFPDPLPDAATLELLVPFASGFILPDQEGLPSATTILMAPLFAHPDDADNVLDPPRVRLVLKRTVLRDAGGTVRWVQEQAWLTEHGPDEDAAPLQNAAFTYHGPPAMPGSDHPFPSVYHIQRATGTWATATNVLVVPGPAGWRKVFLTRTVNEQAAAPSAPRLAL
jgi:hypothetical protein